MVYDSIIIGGGQSGLACGYYLRRTSLQYVILDNQPKCGGSWNQVWDSITLFSPAKHSSLPGWMMPDSKHLFPTKAEVIQYLCRYEARYKIPIQRNTEVVNIRKRDHIYEIETSNGVYKSKTVIAATGTFGRPFVPVIEGADKYEGLSLHSSRYISPKVYAGKKVLIVGEGNSGAQLLAELSNVSDTAWATSRSPTFLPEEVDGRVLFDVASAKYAALQKGEKFDASKYNLGSIVMVPSVKEARSRNALRSKGTLKRLYTHGVVWEDEEKEEFDVIIWCTGFGYNTGYLQHLIPLDASGKAEVTGTRSNAENGLWMVGFGGWTGYASATLIGVGRSARETVKEVAAFLDQ